MIAQTNKRHFPKMVIVMAVLLASAGVFSCNNAAEEKKEEAPAAVDTATKVMVDTAHHAAADTPKIPIDTIKETKVPPPPRSN